jgi:hypothetical protein
MTDSLHDPYVGHGPTRYEGIDAPGSAAVTDEQVIALAAAAPSDMLLITARTLHQVYARFRDAQSALHAAGLADSHLLGEVGLHLILGHPTDDQAALLTVDLPGSTRLCSRDLILDDLLPAGDAYSPEDLYAQLLGTVLRLARQLITEHQAAITVKAAMWLGNGLADAEAALAGDSNAAEHDALHSLAARVHAYLGTEPAAL